MILNYLIILNDYFQPISYTLNSAHTHTQKTTYFWEYLMGPDWQEGCSHENARTVEFQKERRAQKS